MFGLGFVAADRAVQRVWRLEPTPLYTAGGLSPSKLANCRRLAGRLADEGQLAGAGTIASASDVLLALIFSDLVEAVARRSPLVRQHLADAL